MIAQLIVFSIMVFQVTSNVLVIGPNSDLGGIMIFMVKGITEGILFLICSHYVLRGFLKQTIVPKGFNFKRGYILVLLITAVANLHVLGTYKLETAELMGKPKTGSVSIVIDDEEHILDFESPVIWGVATFNQLTLYILWSLAYIFWHSAKSKRELQKQMQEVRIQQLTNQLNPHFLFNAFNSIRAMIFEDKEKAADLVTQLSELFRTHLQAHLKPAATLGEEWRIARQYLDIEKVRMEERMQVNCQIDETLKSQKLPTLTLLTLIENAVKHGIAPNPQQGFINILAQPSNDSHWCLQVENSWLAQSNDIGTQTGLTNTRQRLQLMFGDRASIKIDDVDNKFLVTVELPRV